MIEVVLTANRPLDAGLVLCLRMSEGVGLKVHDISKYRNHGDIYNASWVDSKAGFGKALSFDGVNNYVQIGAPAGGSLDPAHITMEMWIKFNAIPYTSQIALNKEGKYRFIAGDVDTTHLSIRYATDITGWGAGTLIGDTALEAELWYHAVATYDGSYWKLYLNGQLDGNKIETGDLVSNAANLYIGVFSPPSGFPFNGIIDEVRIYNRALSSAEVMTRFKSRGFI